MKFLEAQQWAVAKNSEGKLGLIATLKSEQCIWAGYSINDDFTVGKYDWIGELPSILFHLEPDVVLIRHTYDLDNPHIIDVEKIQSMLRFYFKIEEYKVQFKSERNVTLNNVFHFFQNVDHSINFEDFCKTINKNLPDNYGTHGHHCCSQHGCKYGDRDCPVESGLISQEYECEECWEDGQYVEKVIHELDQSLGDNNLIDKIKSDKILMAKLKLLKNRGIDLNIFIK